MTTGTFGISDHHKAMEVLNGLTPEARADNAREVEILETVAASAIAGTWCDHQRVTFDDAIKSLEHAPRYHLDFAPTDDADKARRYLGPTARWALVDRSGHVHATFTAPADGRASGRSGSVMITGPADLVGSDYPTRNAARRAVVAATTI